MKIGVVGSPNAGKTTFLNAACLTEAEMAAYPFTTIKPNRGTAVVRAKCPCKELGVEHCDGKRLVPIAMVDVAGLVPGAHEGKGMGNQFLSDLADADALIHVVDASGRSDTEGNPGNGDPVKDVEFLEDEIEQWMLGILMDKWDSLKRKIEMKTVKPWQAVHEQLSGLKVREEDVKKAVKELGVDSNATEKQLLEVVKKVRKPILVAANKMDLPESEENIKRLDNAVACCAEAELALRRANESNLISYSPGDASFDVGSEVPEKQKKALDFIKSLLAKFGSTGVQKAIDGAAYGLLDLIVVYPVEDENKLTDKKGRVLPDAYLVPKGSTALDLAYRVHTEIGEKFVGAVDARTKKRVGKDYELKNGDVIRILV
ncbi:MAG: redox-regulated ATPase YchF [Candidatus Diapherotrites archaeon]|nr:redox-regulated ATPase YchF [Candidatus Diapherotrites archaeon]